MTEPIVQQEDVGLYCPTCAYDLRFTTEPRCPECGNAFNREELKVSRIPWVHRRTLGRFRGFFRTLRFVILSPGALSREVALPVAWIDAVRFKWTAIWVAALALSGWFVALCHGMNMSAMSVMPAPIAYGGAVVSLDEYPFFVLWTGPGLFLLIFLSVLTAGGVLGWWIRMWFWMYGGSQRQRTGALSCYLAAWCIPFTFVIGVDGAARIFSEYWNSDYALVGIGLLALLNVVVVVGVWVRPLLLLRGATHCGGWKTSIAVVGIPLGGIMLAWFSVAAVTYVVGVVAIIVTSLMR